MNASTYQDKDPVPNRTINCYRSLEKGEEKHSISIKHKHGKHVIFSYPRACIYFGRKKSDGQHTREFTTILYLLYQHRMDITDMCTVQEPSFLRQSLLEEQRGGGDRVIKVSKEFPRTRMDIKIVDKMEQEGKHNHLERENIPPMSAPSIHRSRFHLHWSTLSQRDCFTEKEHHSLGIFELSIAIEDPLLCLSLFLAFCTVQNIPLPLEWMFLHHATLMNIIAAANASP